MWPRLIIAGLAPTAALLAVMDNAAFACSPALGPMVLFFFDTGSSAFNRQHESPEAMIKQVMPRGVSPKCYSLVVVDGHADKAEAMTPEVRVDLARAEAVREALVRAGMPRESIEIAGRMADEPVISTAPGVSEPRNRRVVVSWSQTWGAGRERCDPATLNDQSVRPVTTCGIPKYAACYWELTDGTICNFGDVPDPNPQRYSVIQ
jgi:hypothetical protein